MDADSASIRVMEYPMCLKLRVTLRKTKIDMGSADQNNCKAGNG